MYMENKQTLKGYLNDNPQELKMLFSNIFSRYLIRYYEEAKDYSVFFDTRKETSYMDNRGKQIVISMKNIEESLKLDVPLLAVAYHELAHVLFTSFAKHDWLMEQIRDRYPYQLHIHTNFHDIWNMVEDEYIERKMAKKYPYLAKIIGPIRKLIQADGKLLSWRRQEPTDKKLEALAEEYANGCSNQRSFDILFEIFQKYYYTSPIKIEKKKIEQPPVEEEKIDEEEVEVIEDENGEEEVEVIEDENDEEDIEDDEESDPNEESESEDGVKDTSSNDEKENQVEDISDEKYSNYDIDDILKGLEKNPIDNIIVENEEDEALLDVLKEMGELNRAEKLKEAYNRAVKGTPKAASDEYYVHELPFKYNAKQIVMAGMTAAKAKSYSSNITSRISIPKLVEALATNKQPDVFYGKGKDIEFLKKVVVFEDVSGSTGPITTVFSCIAYSLVKAFQTSEWWLYANYLAPKHPKDYDKISMHCSRRRKSVLSIGTGTQAQHLLYVMEKMKNEDCIFVVITDGDMGRFFNDSYKQLFEAYKDKMVVIGLLDSIILEKMKFTVPLTNSANYAGGAKLQKIVVDTVNKAFEVVRYRVGAMK